MKSIEEEYLGAENARYDLTRFCKCTEKEKVSGEPSIVISNGKGSWKGERWGVGERSLFWSCRTWWIWCVGIMLALLARLHLMIRNQIIGWSLDIFYVWIWDLTSVCSKKMKCWHFLHYWHLKWRQLFTSNQMYTSLNFQKHTWSVILYLSIEKGILGWTLGTKRMIAFTPCDFGIKFM